MMTFHVNEKESGIMFPEWYGLMDQDHDGPGQNSSYIRKSPEPLSRDQVLYT